MVLTARRRLAFAGVPHNGRNFEYASGEDPFLGYHLVNGAIKGIQSENVIANAKHWVQNNEETNRHGVTEIVDDRTRFEMYYPPFAGAVDAGVGSIMCSCAFPHIARSDAATPAAVAAIAARCSCCCG